MANNWSPPHENFYVGLEDEAGGIMVERPRDATKHIYDQLVKLFRVETLYRKDDGERKKPLHAIIIPAAKALYTKRIRWAPLACAYAATESYMKKMLGAELTFEDREWFLAHGLLEPGGLPLPYTARVIQELIEPYRLRIERIQLEPGLLLTGDLAQWPTILGMNPMARADRATTNAMYAEATGMDINLVNDMFRMEYNPVSMRPAIICEAAADSPHGHASFAAARQKRSGQEWLSITLSRVRDDPWPNGAPKWEPVKAPLVDTLDLWAMVRAEEAARRPAFSSTQPVGFSGDNKGFVGLGARIRQLTAGAPAPKKREGPLCVMCDDVVQSVGLVCGRCWSLVWEEFKCANHACGVYFALKPPTFMRVDLKKDELHAACANCKKEHMLKTTTNADAAALIRALGGRFTDADRAHWQMALMPAWFDEHGNPTNN